MLNMMHLPTAAIRIETRVAPRAAHPPVITPDDSSESCCLHSSRSIPIQHQLDRTDSELQLHEDEAMADYRDYCMYQRIVSGMVKSQQDRRQNMNQLHWGMTPAATTNPQDPLNSMIRTRHEQVPSQASFSTLNDDGYDFSYEIEDEDQDDKNQDEMFVLDM